MSIPSHSPADAPSTPVAAVEGIRAADLRAALHRARRAVDRHAAALTRLDAVLGDGDHGDNLSTGFRAVEELLPEVPAETLPGDLLREVGHRLVATVGGASGPLLGTAFIEAGFRAADAAVLEPPLVAEMLVVAAAGLARRGRCASATDALDRLAVGGGVAATVAGGGYGAEARERPLLRMRGMRSTRPSRPTGPSASARRAVIGILSGPCRASPPLAMRAMT